MTPCVLLVDDEEGARTSLAQRLQRSDELELAGAAGSLEEAQVLLSETHPDVILFDLHRRDGGELELCRALRSLTDAPLVALASFMTPERWEQAKEAGISDYLLKYVDTDQLGRELVRIVERQRARNVNTERRPGA